jgi:hypothetical protein
MKKLLILAIFLRLLIAAFYFHPDIKTYNFQASFLRHGVFNIYTYLVNNKATLPIKEEFVYFPLTYLTVGGYQGIIAPILGKGFDSWLSNANVTAFVKDPGIFKFLLALKLPILVVDIAIAYLLMKFFDEKKDKKKAFVFWLFNPFTIVIFYIFSNVDIYPVALTLTALLLTKRNKLILSSLILGVAAGFKLYPILLVPFLFLKAGSLKEKLLVITAPAVTLGIVTLPFLSSAFIQSALISGLTTRIFNPGFSVGFGEFNIVGLTAMVALFFYGLLIDKKANLLHYWVSLFLIIFSFSHFNIQWLAWVAPFLVILSVQKPKLAITIFILAVAAFLIPPLYEDRSMTFGLLRTYSTLFDLLPTPFVAIKNVYDPYNLQSIFHSIVAGGSAIVILKMFKEEKV